MNNLLMTMMSQGNILIGLFLTGNYFACLISLVWLRLSEQVAHAAHQPLLPRQLLGQDIKPPGTTAMQQAAGCHASHAEWATQHLPAGSIHPKPVQRYRGREQLLLVAITTPEQMALTPALPDAIAQRPVAGQQPEPVR